MPKFTVPVDNFTLQSTYACGLTATHNEDGSVTYGTYTAEGASTARVTKSFAYSLPSKSEIKSMKIFATIGTPTWGVNASTINGQPVGVSKTVSVDIDISGYELSGVVQAAFAYMCAAPRHQHDVSDCEEVGRETQGGKLVVAYKKYHYSDIDYSNVYLEIEYMCGAYLYSGNSGELAPYQLYHAESGELVPYQLFNAVNGELVQY